MIKILVTILAMFILIVPFFSTPLGEEFYHSYQETQVHKTIYCQYVDWFGAEGFDKIKYYLKCKLDLEGQLK